MIAHIPIPHCHDAVPKMAEVMFPEIQVLIKKGSVGMNEKKSRARSEVISATITSTRSSTHVYPIWYKTEPPAKVWTFFAVASTMVPMV